MKAHPSPPLNFARLDYLDAVRAFALILGVVFHAGLSFMPVAMGWAVMDVSTSGLVGVFLLISHSFRMVLFFVIAGFFAHLTFHRRGAVDFVQSRMLRIGVPFVLGWFILRPLVVSGWIMGYASLGGEMEFWAGLKGGFESLKTLPEGLLVGTHLWFLYYLLLVTFTTLALRALVLSSGAWSKRLVDGTDAAMGWLAESRLGLWALVLPTTGLLWLMRGWGLDTPDKSLLPHLPLFALYGGGFVFGWMLHRSEGHIVSLSRLTPARWILAAVGIITTIVLSGIQGDPSHPQFMHARLAFVGAYALMMWTLIFLTIGVFQRLCRRPRALVRYIADGSYWMYLIHLPIVVWLQVAVAEWPIHWTLKLAGISIFTILFSLLSYDLFVRSTWVGRLLNGRRRPRLLRFDSVAPESSPISADTAG